MPNVPRSDVLPATTANGRARHAALRDAALPRQGADAAAPVEYRSQGRVLIAGDAEAARAAAARLDALRRTVLVGADFGPASSWPAGTDVLHGELKGLEGHLGAFVAHLATGEHGDGETVDAHFDLVLDLGSAPVLRHELPPPGYFAPGADCAALEAAFEQLPELVGSFEKPTFFHYDAALCAHGNSGLTGCTRCIEACPTLAIASAGDRIEVDPYLCQGGGSCATACPSGAIRYAYPPPADLLAALRALLGRYRDAGGRRPWVLLHGAEGGAALVQAAAARLPESVLPFAVEEVGSVGLEAWLAALAYGAGGVALLAGPDTPRSVRETLRTECACAGALTAALGYPPDVVRLLHVLDAEQLAESLAADAPGIEIVPARFATLNEKRRTLRLAVDHLYAAAPRPVTVATLPAGAPFGEILIDTEACTLCMSCVSVCPASALLDGGERPQLQFIEVNCVQCGLCRTACPEHAVTLAPRMLFDTEQARTRRVLHEEAPFCCIACGKPFATQRMMQRIAQKLEGHWMYRTEAARRRLQMCEDCRVADLYLHEQQDTTGEHAPWP